MAIEKILNIEVVRNGNIELNIKVAKELEDFFKNGIPIESTTQERKQFYQRLESAQFINLIRENNFVDDYSVGLLNYNGCFNIAFIRTVGISQETQKFVFKEKITEESLVKFIRDFQAFIKNIYVRYCKKVLIKASLEVSDL